MSEDTKEILKVLGVVLVVLMLATTGLIFANIMLHKMACADFGEISGKQTRSTLNECYVNSNEKWLELDRYQAEMVYNKDFK